MTPTGRTPYTPTDDEVRVLAQWIAQAASDWADVESDEHEHGLACTNGEAYTDDARAALVDLDARALESRAARDARVRAETLAEAPRPAEVSLASRLWTENGPSPAAWESVSRRQRDRTEERMRVVLSGLADAHRLRAASIEQETR